MSDAEDIVRDIFGDSDESDAEFEVSTRLIAIAYKLMVPFRVLAEILQT